MALWVFCDKPHVMCLLDYISHEWVLNMETLLGYLES
jgi:hypothetical protein